MAGKGKMEKDKRQEAFGKVMDIFIGYVIKVLRLAEDETEAYNMLTDYVGKKMMEQ